MVSESSVVPKNLAMYKKAIGKQKFDVRITSCMSASAIVHSVHKPQDSIELFTYDPFLLKKLLVEISKDAPGYRVFGNIKAVRIKQQYKNKQKNAGHLNFTSLIFIFALAFWKEKIASKDVDRVLEVVSMSSKASNICQSAAGKGVIRNILSLSGSISVDYFKIQPIC